MSLGIYPAFNPPVPEAKFDGLGELLAMQFEALDQLATDHGVTRLTAFADVREIPEDFDGSPEELERVMGPWNDWFACCDGRVAFEELARIIADDSAAAEQLESPELLVEELRSIARALVVGESKGARFRLEMS